MNREELKINLKYFSDYREGKLTRQQLIKLYITSGTMYYSTLGFIDFCEKNGVENNDEMFDLCIQEGGVDDLDE